MPAADKPTVNEAAAQAKLLCLAYVQVLGTDSNRSPAQKLVWADMEHRGYKKRSTMIADAKGQVCALRMSQAEGQRIYHLQTEEFIGRALRPEDSTKPIKARTE